MTGVPPDLVNAWRTLRAMRGAGLLAVATLAAGIAAATTMFAIVYANLWRPIPFAEPDRLVMIWLNQSTQQQATNLTRFSFPEYTALTEQATAFEALASFTRTTNISVALADRVPTPRHGEFVSPTYWRVLRLTPLAGRLTTADDDGRRGTGAVAVISARLWQDVGRDPSIIGRTIRVNAVPITVIGVVADGFHGLSERSDIWIPSTMAPQLTYAQYLTTPQHFIAVLGRLAPGRTVDDANRELSVLGRRVANAGVPDPNPATAWTAVATPANDVRIQPGARRTAWLLVATLVSALLIAYANVISVVLARRQERDRDLAVRRALGASVGRLLRQVIAEAAMLCGIAGAAGIVVAPMLMGLVRRFAPDGLPSTRTGYVQISSFATPAMDGTVLAFAIAATAVAALLVAVVPAIDTTRAQPASTLREDSRTGSRRRLRTLRTVVAAEIAVAAVLIAGASVLYASARGLERERAGFDATSVLTARVVPPGSRYPPESGPRVLTSLLTAIQHVPGVALAAVNRCAPLDDCSRANVYQAGQPKGVGVERHYISADYFRVLGMRILRGRGITEDDRDGHPLVTIVNETAARRFWPGADPVGRTVWFSNPPGFDDPTHPVEVVGVVNDVKYGTIDEPLASDFYTSYQQFAFPDSMILVKVAPGADDGVMGSIGRAIAGVDPDLALIDPMSLDERVQSAWATPRFHARAVVVFAAFALVLAAVGVYGIAAVAVSLRAREMGIRLAVGADPPAIVRLVLREHLGLGILGATVGIAVSLLAGRFLQGLLYGVSASDPRALIAAVLGLLAAVVIGAILPSRRAGLVDPAALLRKD